MVRVVWLRLRGFCRVSVLTDCLIWLLHKLAVICLNSGDYSHALIAYKVILRVRPTDRLATFQMVHLYNILGRDEESIQILENWLQSAANDLDAHLTLSQLYTANDEMTRAREHLDASAQIAPNSPEMLLASGDFYRRNGNLDESSALVDSILKDGEHPRILTLLAHNLIDQGKRGEAVEILERAVRLAPDVPSPYYLLARCRYYRDASHPHVEYMGKRLAKGDLPAHVRKVFHFALGEIFDSLGEWDAAFAHFKAGNDLQRLGSNVNMAEVTRFIDQEIETFTKKCVSGVHGALDRHGIDDLAQLYLSRVMSVTGGVGRFVDKALNNWNTAGLIAILFPRATFVHCHRNPLDTCLSCYFTYLPHVPFASDLMTLGLLYRQYERLMAHWRSVFPARICELEYEELVSDPESHIRKLLAHCQLPWHDGCLTPHQTERVVLTASASQVKMPIHSRSVGRWKNYEKHIGPLIQTLGEKRLPRESGRDSGLRGGTPRAAGAGPLR